MNIPNNNGILKANSIIVISYYLQEIYKEQNYCSDTL